MAFKAVFHYPTQKSDQEALMKRLSALRAEKTLKYLCSLEPSGSTAEQLAEEISAICLHKK